MEVHIRKVRDLEEDLEALLEAVAWRDVIGKGDRVLIKPNFCTLPFVPGVTTDPALLRCLVGILGERGEVCVGETNTEGRKAWRLDADLGCELIDLSEAEGVEIKVGGTAFHIPRLALDCRVVNVPVLKTHSFTTFTLGIKNLFGLVQEREKSSYHYAIDDVLLAILGEVRPALNILDAIHAMDGIGPITGRVRRTDLLMASRDVVALDMAVCSLAGLDYRRVEHIRRAAEIYHTVPEILGQGARLDLEVPRPSRVELLGAYLQRNDLTRRVLMSPGVYSVARRTKVLLRHFVG